MLWLRSDQRLKEGIQNKLGEEGDSLSIPDKNYLHGLASTIPTDFNESDAKKALKKEAKLAASESTLRKTLMDSINDVIHNPFSKGSTLRWVEKESSELTKRKERAKALEERLMNERLLALLHGYCYESAFFFLSDKNHHKAILALTILQGVSPDNQFVTWMLARTYALEMNLEKALEQLEKSIELGFADKNQLLNEPDLESIRSTKEFQVMIEKLPD